MGEKFFILLFGIRLVFLMACHSTSTPEKEIPQQYLHIAHTRMDDNSSFIAELKEKDFSIYDGLWIGGDLAKNTSINEATIQAYDSIFQFGESTSPTAKSLNLWALGNHDYDNLDRIKKYTKRPPFYAFANDKIQFLVLDTQDSLSHMIGAQLELIQNTIDTLAFAKYLVLLHHKLMWMPDHMELKKQMGKVTNGDRGECFYCTNPNNFYQDVYPLLVKAKKRGIEVICIGGDLGQKTKSFAYETKEGIHFLASGLNYNDDDNQVILFDYFPISEKLEWRFEFFNNLK